MLYHTRSMLGLYHAVASVRAPWLVRLPSEASAESRRVLRDAAGETEHWLTSTGGARVEFLIEEEERGPLACDRDVLLFLLTIGQRYSAFETSRRMAEVEQRYRTSRWQSLRPARSVRSDVMLFTNSLWHTRVSEDPDVNARYLAWHSLHGLQETVEAMKDQASELDQYKRDQFDRMVGILVFVFLPVSLACGFFSGAQFQEMSPAVGIPGNTTGLGAMAASWHPWHADQDGYDRPRPARSGWCHGPGLAPISRTGRHHQVGVRRAGDSCQAVSIATDCGETLTQESDTWN